MYVHHVGQTLPDVTFKVRIGPDWYDKTTEDLFGGTKAIVVGLPGAFTPV